jgi:hypothetical protein
MKTATASIFLERGIAFTKRASRVERAERQERIVFVRIVPILAISPGISVQPGPSIQPEKFSNPTSDADRPARSADEIDQDNQAFNIETSKGVEEHCLAYCETKYLPYSWYLL